MSAGFYERLGLQPDASPEEVKQAYQRSLGRLVRKLRTLRTRGADASAVEAEREELREAWEVLSDPARRRRYQLLLRLEGELGSLSPEQLRERLIPALVDPAAAAAVDLLRAVVDLPLGPALEEPLDRPGGQRGAHPRPRAAAPPQVAPVSMLSPEEREQRAAHAAAPPPEPMVVELAARGVQVAPPVPPPPPAPPDLRALADHLGYDGRYLAAVRKAQDMSLDDLARTTRISARYLEAIEDNRFERLPAAVFVRGYLKEIATTLCIDEAPLIQGYMALYARARGA